LYIGRLQLKGFKSFGGAHDLALSSGFTAIVGPNGSGKSNLLDALRWALGDSNAGRLRIARQNDLLFQGSVSLPQAKEAEVSLQLREESRSCSIKRRVFSPDGVTLLLVDNVRKTLAELDDVKREWKLEGDRFAFIGQGEVAEVIQQRPSARRTRLETLFGIDVYRKRRAEAAERLAVVKEEYEQLRNVMAELSARREEIAPEVRRAAQIREILDSIEEERKLLYWLRRERLERMLDVMREDARRLELERDAASLWSLAWKSALEAVDAELVGTDTVRRQQIWELEQCRTRFDSLTKSGFASASSLLSSKTRLIQARAEYEEVMSAIRSLADEQKSADSGNNEANEALRAGRKALDAVENKWREHLLRVEREKQKREELNNKKGMLEAELQQLRAKLSFLGRDLVSLRDKKAHAPDPRKSIDAEIKRYTEERDRLLKEQELLVKRHGELYARVQNLASELQRVRREASQARSRLNEASDVMQAELYPSAVQYLLSSAKLNRLDAAPRAVIDVFSCDMSLSAAFEAYLGGRQFQLLVEDLEEAGRCIEKLKANNKGRATFLPLERCRPRYPDRSFRLPSHGITGWAIDLVRVEEHWLPAIEQIMGDLLIVNSYEVGQELVRSGFKSPIATLEGDVFQPGGTVSGGRSLKSGRTLEMKSHVAKLEEEYKKISSLSDKLTGEFKKLEAEELAVSEQKESYTKQIRELDGRVALAADRKESITKEYRRIEDERARILRNMGENGVRWQEIRAELLKIEELRDEQAYAEDDHRLIEERERLRADVAVAEERLRGALAFIERISAQIRTEKRKASSLEEEISELDQKCVKERANLARVGKGCLEIHERRKRLASDIERYAKGSSVLEAKREYIRKRLSSAEEKTISAINGLSAAFAKKNEAERELEELISTWEEQYPYGKAAFMRPDTDIDVDDLRKKIKEGERKIKAFGDVDMGMLSEDRNLKDRLAFLGEQLDDVRSGAAELESLIAEADRQAHKIFTDALQDVDKRFCELFKRLFGGGEAHLEMTEGDTIWDAGVDVIARPPGKHPQGINQLSGGEQSLAAISLLFASMEVAGCPIAVLDEVDAALDEVNLRRFSELARDYAKNRQVLAMTHRRATMERADVLYGVTLSEPGLSQVIGVRLEDWA